MTEKELLYYLSQAKDDEQTILIEEENTVYEVNRKCLEKLWEKYMKKNHLRKGR